MSKSETLARENSFCKTGNNKRWSEEPCLSPHTAPAQSDSDIVPVQGLSVFGGSHTLPG